MAQTNEMGLFPRLDSLRSLAATQCPGSDNGNGLMDFAMNSFNHDPFETMMIGDQIRILERFNEKVDRLKQRGFAEESNRLRKNGFGHFDVVG